ncbi:hypothetical protein BBC27_05355 [Acidithiobacillus ferrivorans]|uniref:Lipoyl-binding domain-containing protein n=1 Tax=Acidithiobacillus ferrivorans TaxID=160808 RepID=A0A1B9C1Y4_9PROT|nr:lipoyl domain-containing protein [Acidithiobacillus ferrivorans]OCB03978.1 hypothetical protein BBC27_05355 [Acidithiobacillus ferrivorans]
MKNEITMPVLSDTMQTGRLTRWNKAVGEAVKQGESIAEVETDKAILDVEAFASGYLAGPLAAVDTDIPVRQAIGYIVDTRNAITILKYMLNILGTGSGIYGDHYATRRKDGEIQHSPFHGVRCHQ